MRVCVECGGGCVCNTPLTAYSVSFQPPFNATAALEAMKIMGEEKERFAKLRRNTLLMHQRLTDVTYAMDQVILRSVCALFLSLSFLPAERTRTRKLV